jgi:hypothetical protein
MWPFIGMDLVQGVGKNFVPRAFGEHLNLAVELVAKNTVQSTAGAMDS